MHTPHVLVVMFSLPLLHILLSVCLPGMALFLLLGRDQKQDGPNAAGTLLLGGLVLGNRGRIAALTRSARYYNYGGHQDPDLAKIVNHLVLQPQVRHIILLGKPASFKKMYYLAIQHYRFLLSYARADEVNGGALLPEDKGQPFFLLSRDRPAESWLERLLSEGRYEAVPLDLLGRSQDRLYLIRQRQRARS